LAFAIASTITPLILGDVIGALSSGAVADAASRIATASFAEVYVAPWLAPLPLAIGAMALALVAFLAAVYLTVAARDDALREDFRRRALAAAVVEFVTAFGALLVARRDAPRMGGRLVAAPWALWLQVATGAAALTAIGSLWRRRYAVARVAAGAQVSLILWGWALSQYPFVIPPTLTIRAAAAPNVTLELLLWGLAGGVAILVPSLVYLFRTFNSTRL
jgi:cytochrome d ubiquinol oxidase subunit II